jgi:sRNA-binding carbon storage regulator CsrA
MALNLTRKFGEKVYVTGPGGLALVIEVRRLGRGLVTLGVTAPESVKILREEHYGAAERAEIEARAAGGPAGN